MKHVKINFHGFLKKLIPETIEGNFRTLHDVFMYISHNYPQFKAPLNIGRYAVQVDEYNSKESIYCPLHTDTIEIRPFSNLAKSAGMGQIIVGAALIVVGVLVAAFVPGGQAIGIKMIYSGIFMIGMGMLTYLLTPEIKNKGDHNPGDNKYLGSPKNTTASGTPISIGYGLYKVYGHFLSFNISSSSVIVAGSND